MRDIILSVVKSVKHFASPASKPLKMAEQAKKLLLPSLDWTRPKDPPMSLGHASILANLKKHQVPVVSKSWSINHESFSQNAVIKFILDNAGDDTAVAFGAYVWNEAHIQHILKNIVAGGFPGPIILGGPQISYTSNNLEKLYPEANIFIRGYAEDALVRLLQTEEKFPAIKGVHFSGTVDKGTVASIDLDTLPSPFLQGIIPAQKFMRWGTQLGCPFKCAFCQYRDPDKSKNNHQYFQLPRIIQEAQWFATNTVVEDIHVVDATFNSGPNYLTVLATLSEHKFRGKIAFQTRAEMVTTEFLDAVEKLNETATVTLEFGLQSTDKEVLKKIDRPTNLKKVSRILKEVNERKIESEISLIFGLPGQTVRSFEESVTFCLQHNIPIIHAFPLMLLRGTPLYEKQAELGLVVSETFASTYIDRIQNQMPHVVAGPSFSEQDWRQMANMAEELEKANECYLKNRAARVSEKRATQAAQTIGLFASSQEPIKKVDSIPVTNKPSL